MPDHRPDHRTDNRPDHRPDDPDGRLILILDDHQLFALGVQAMLATLPGRHLCLARADAAQAVSEVEAGSLRPSLCIVDYYIPGTNAPDLVRRLRLAAPDAPVLLCSGSNSPADRQAALDAGAAAFINKSLPPEEILAAIEASLRGEAPARSDPAQVLAEFGLTERQLDILLLASKGCSNKEIARMLSVSPETVKTHLSAAFRRLGVSGRVEALAQLRSNGLG